MLTGAVYPRVAAQPSNVTIVEEFERGSPPSTGDSLELMLNIGTASHPAQITSSGTSFLFKPDGYELDVLNSTTEVKEDSSDGRTLGWLYQSGMPGVEILTDIYADSIRFTIRSLSSTPAQGWGFAVRVKGYIIIGVEDYPGRKPDPDSHYQATGNIRLAYFPNQVLSVELPTDEQADVLIIRDQHAREVYHRSLDTESAIHKLDLSMLSTGYYLLEVRTDVATRRKRILLRP